MVRVAVVTAGLSLLQMANFAGSPCLPDAASAHGDAAKWSEDHYTSALDALLPYGENEGLSTEIEWRMVARIRPAHGAETWVRVTRTWTGTFTVSVARPEARSILLQLEDLREKNPTADLAELLWQIRIRRTKADSEHCRRLGLLLRKIDRVQMPAVPSSDLAMDATQYEVEIQTRSNCQRFSLSDVGENPLLTWTSQVADFAEEPCKD